MTIKRQLSEFAAPEVGGVDVGHAAHAQEPAGSHGETDREGAMAKADLYKLASYAHKLYQQINDDDQLEAWVQAKITKAADYVASVYHFLEYEMKFSEYGHHLDNSDTLSESQKAALKAKLTEARQTIKQLKIAQAEKVAAINEGEDTVPCEACGGTGHVAAPVREFTPDAKEKAQKYNRLMKATKAAHKRMDANHNGTPDDEEMEEGFDADAKVGAKKKTATGTLEKTATGVKHTRNKYEYDPGSDDMDDKRAKAKARKEKELGESFDEKDPVGTKKKTASGTLEKTKTGVKHTRDKYEYDPGSDDMDDKRAKAKARKERDLDEAAPSAGLSKAKKSATVKKAKAGGDIGKPGKGFAKVAAKAAKEYGSKEKGEKVAAAAMWKNIKETTAYLQEKSKMADKDYDGDGKIETGSEEHAGAVDKAIKASKKKETVKESTDLTRMQDQVARLTRSETHVLKENSEADAIRALTQRLLG